MSNHVLVEDDCAPDSINYFDKKMKELTGYTSGEFRHLAGNPTVSDDNMHMEWICDGWVLSFDGDDPQYKLDKVEN